MSIELSRDGGATFEVLAAAAPNTGSFVWTASGPDTAAARVRVTSSGAVPASGMGAAFQIVTAGAGRDVAGRGRQLGDRDRAHDFVVERPCRQAPRSASNLSRDGGATWTALYFGVARQRQPGLDRHVAGDDDGA